jgi:hypothetical protein
VEVGWILFEREDAAVECTGIDAVLGFAPAVMMSVRGKWTYI